MKLDNKIITKWLLFGIVIFIIFGFGYHYFINNNFPAMNYKSKISISDPDKFILYKNGEPIEVIKNEDHFKDIFKLVNKMICESVIDKVGLAMIVDDEVVSIYRQGTGLELFYDQPEIFSFRNKPVISLFIHLSETPILFISDENGYGTPALPLPENKDLLKIIDNIYELIAGTVEKQESPELLTVDIYNPITGQTETKDYSVELDAYLAYLSSGPPRSALEDAVSFLGRELDFESKEERLSFVNNVMVGIADSVNIEPDLFYPDGPVLAFGVNYEAYFIVDLYEKAEYDGLVIDRVYASIEASSLCQGIYEPPVVFRSTGLVVLD